MEEIDIKKDAFRKRWASYFDLLGFSDLVQTKGELSVFDTITTALEEFNRKRNPNDHLIDRMWFSDSFILYSQGASDIDFSCLEQVSRHFFLSLIQKEIPVRGALAFGELYADKDNNILFGKALLEAYKYSENQDWIGFILTISAEKQMEAVNLLAQKRFNYRKSIIPWKIDPEKNSEHKEHYPESLFACEFLHQETGRDPCVEILSQLEERALLPEIRRKYRNSIEFIQGYSKKINGTKPDSKLFQ